MPHLPDLDELIQRIREEAERPEYRALQSEPLAPLSNRTAVSAAAPSGLESSKRNSSAASVDDLLLIADPEEFIDQAYQVLLGRPADPAGAAHHRSLLDAGFGRPFVLSTLRASEEGRSAASKLPGFGAAPALFQLGRLGYRLGLGRLARMMNRWYQGWRYRRLLASGRLLTGLRRQEEERSRWIDRAHEQWRQAEQGLTERLERYKQRQEEERQQGLDRFRGLERRLEVQTERQQAQDRALEAAVSDINLLRARLKVLQQRAYPERPVGSASEHRPQDAALVSRLDAYYLAFEEVHRGSEAQVAGDQGIYLSDLANLPDDLLMLPMLDIGCGRGEWLRLLADQGFEAMGVDLNPDTVVRARRQGLDVQQSDALQYLADLPDESHAAVTGFHVIEHLPFGLLFQLVEQAWRVLAPGGRLIVETPNPENLLVGSHTFYHDFSHRCPVTPTALRFLVGYHGFADIRVWRLHPYPEQDRLIVDTPLAERINGHLYGPQDYALLATKPIAESGERDSATGAAGA